MTFSKHSTSSTQSSDSSSNSQNQTLDSESLSVRDRIHQQVFPNSPLIQEFMTHLTGCPHTGQTPLFNLSVYHYILLYGVTLVGGIVLSWLSWQQGWIPLVGVGWLLTLGGASGCNFGLIHQSSHGRLTGHKTFDLWFCRMIAVLIFVKDFDQYVQGHILHHKAKTHQTSQDNTIKLLTYVGIEPGLEAEDYWKQLSKIVSPIFLTRFIIHRRLIPSLFSSNRVSRVLAWSIWSVIVGAILLTHSEIPFFIAYVVPVIVIFSPLFILRHCFEHKFPTEDVNKTRNKLYVALSTDAIFLGEVPPSQTLEGFERYLTWAGWWLRLLCWHGLWRWTVCPYDVPVHDYHTRMAGNPKEDSPNAIWHRQAQVEAGYPGWPTPYSEVWGLFNAISVVFHSFSQLPKDYEF